MTAATDVVELAKARLATAIIAGKYRVESHSRLRGHGHRARRPPPPARRARRDQVPARRRPARARARRALPPRSASRRRLKSEHVARVDDVGTLPDGKPYMVMELLEGIDLGRLLEDAGQLAVPFAVDYVLQACDALAEAHAHRHRAPRHQADEPLRHLAPRRLTRSSRSSTSASRRPPPPPTLAHADRLGARHARVHVPGADALGAHRRRALRHLVARHRALRAGRGHHAVRGPELRRAVRRGRDRTPARPCHRARARARPRTRAREVRRRSLRHRSRSSPTRPRPVRERPAARRAPGQSHLPPPRQARTAPGRPRLDAGDGPRRATPGQIPEATATPAPAASRHAFGRTSRSQRRADDLRAHRAAGRCGSSLRASRCSRSAPPSRRSS